MSADQGSTAPYAVISSDCHAGADLRDYRAYLDPRYREEFDAWADAYVNPWGDLAQPDADRNWNSERRLKELDAEGVAGEVLFPNTIPPFFPSVNLVAPPPSKEDSELRWAGLRAHNRWLADFCSRAPERRAGVAQIMLDDVDAAVREIYATKEAGLRGGVLLPGSPESGSTPPLFAPDYEPIWAALAETGLPVNHHAGGAGPIPGPYDVGRAVWVFETHWWAHRALWHLIFGGVLERHPQMRLVFTEQATGWVPALLGNMDSFWRRVVNPTSALHRFGGSLATLPLPPTEYFRRQCYIGASFIRPAEVAMRHEVGVEKIMWGSDYPHDEGTSPYTLEAMRHAFNGVPPAEVRMMLGENAARVYDFDLAKLAPLVERIGPSVAAIATPLERVPQDVACSAFAEEPIRTW